MEKTYQLPSVPTVSKTKDLLWPSFYSLTLIYIMGMANNEERLACIKKRMVTPLFWKQNIIYSIFLIFNTIVITASL